MKLLAIAWVVPLLVGMCAAQPIGLFDVYADNRVQNRPNYITEDLLLLSYCMLLEDAVGAMEEQHAAPQFRRLLDQLRAKLPSGADGNRAFVEVLNALLAGRTESSHKLVAQELKLIADASGQVRSPLFDQTIDYSQFRPRGNYTRSPEMAQYFAAMRYAGTVLFHVKESRATAITAASADRLTAQAVQLARLIRSNAALHREYQSLLDGFAWLFGHSEDLTIDDMAETGADRVQLLEKARRSGRQPVILGGVIDTGKLEQGVTAADALTGWRLLPSRYTPDSAAMQYLVYDNVTMYRGSGRPFTLATINGRAVKGFPRALEVMSLLGSKPAAANLRKSGDTKYEGYSEAMEEARQVLQKGVGLPALHVDLIRFWLSGSGSDAGPRRRLDTAVAFWTLHRHISVLYAKQSYTAVAKSLLLDSRTTAYITPAPELYQRLRQLASEVGERTGYQEMTAYAKLLDGCIEAARALVEGKRLNEESVRFLNHLDLELLKLTKRKDTPVAVDVHTEPNSRMVLMYGTGFAKTIRGRQETRGALLTSIERKQPMDQRLTDEEWTASLLPKP